MMFPLALTMRNPSASGLVVPLQAATSFLRFCITFLTLLWSSQQLASFAARAQETNPQDLQALYDVMYSINYEWDWRTLYTDPCTGGPQGIVCEADSVTGVYYVTQLEFGIISSVDNIVPCSDNATIPPSIAMLRRLDSLFFYSCFVNQTFSIPNEITQLGPSLRLLSFSGNSALVGPIPAGVGNLTGLQRLVLSQNGLQGNIPEELSSLSSLLQLDLSGNKLTGSVPGSLSSLSKLVILDLRYNQLSGELPAALITRGFFSLQRMAMSFNQLQGNIPDAFTQLGLSSLTFLDLSFNNFSGVLPPSLGSSLTNLEDLYLSSNFRMQGLIPTTLGNLVNLVRLDLSSSNYSGAIPGSSFKNLVNLRYLGLSNNKLSGSIPPELGTDLPDLFTLDLENNVLSGAVPFAPSFVQRMGRNLMVSGNPGLCYTSVVEIKFPLQLAPCPTNSSSSSSSSSSVAPDSNNSAAAATMSSRRSQTGISTRVFFVSILYWILELNLL